MRRYRLYVDDYECPHCFALYESDASFQNVNDIEEGRARQCQECGKWYQLVCESVEITLACYPAKVDGEDQSAESDENNS